MKVTSPLLLLTAVRLPLGMVRSLLSKPVTASENEKVTSELSPIFSAVSLMVIDTVGAVRSMV